MDDSTLWSFTTGASFATDFRKFGLNALKLTTSGTTVADLPINIDLTSGYLGCWIKTDEPYNIAGFTLWAQVGGNWGSFFVYSGSITYSGSIFKEYDMDSWKHFTFPKSNYQRVSGVLETDWSRITALRFSLQTSGNLTVNAWVDRIEQFQYASPCTTGGFFTVFIDDGTAPKTYSAKTGIAASYKLWPTWAFNPVGAAANFPALLAWVASGSDACHHGPYQTDYITRSDEPETQEPRIVWNLLYGRLPFASWSVGKYMKYGAWGGGGYCPRALRIAEKNFVLYRSTGGGAESWPPADPMRLRAYYLQGLATSVASAVLTSAIANREWLIFYTHVWDSSLDYLASFAYAQGYSHFGIHQAWSYLKKHSPASELPTDQTTAEGAQEVWAYPPSAASNTIIASYNGPAILPIDYALQDDGGAFTNYTTEANDDNANDVPFFPAIPAANDAFYFGWSTFVPIPYQAVFVPINIGTAGSGTYTVTWEYWTGVSWDNLATSQYRADRTSGFKTQPGWATFYCYFMGTEVYPYGMNWSACSVSSIYARWIRARCNAGTFTTVPSGTRIAFFNPSGGAVTGFSQPVPPRNLTISYSSVSLAPRDKTGTLHIWGMNALGESAYDNFGPGFSGLLGEGIQTFARITALSIVALPPWDTFAVGWGEKLGLSKRLVDARDVVDRGIRAASNFSPTITPWEKIATGLYARHNCITLTSLASSEIIVINYITRNITKNAGELDDNGQ